MRWGSRALVGGHYFDDEQEIGPEALTLLRKVFAEILRERAEDFGSDDELGMAKELVSLFKSGFRSEEELKAMAERRLLLEQDTG